jgi:hypothetical protein
MPGLRVPITLRVWSEDGRLDETWRATARLSGSPVRGSIDQAVDGLCNTQSRDA